MITKRVDAGVIAKLYVWLNKHHDSLRNDTKATNVKVAEIASKEIGTPINAKLIERAMKRLDIPPFSKARKPAESKTQIAIAALEARVAKLEELLK